MAGEEDGELVVQDVVLGLEVRGLDAEDAGEGGLLGSGEEGEVGVCAEKLGETGGGERVLGGDVDSWAGEAMRWRELGCEEEGEEELGFACAAEGGFGFSMSSIELTRRGIFGGYLSPVTSVM